MPETRHSCPGLCGRTVAHRMFACPQCWPRLPEHLRRAISTAWTHRRNHGPGPHRDAMREASAWYAANKAGGAT